MKKTLTGILLATSVLAMAAVQPVSAASTGTGTSSTGAQSTSSFKEIHFVTFQNGRPVDIKAAVTGTATSDTSHPAIDNYMYTTSRVEDGILYHMYAPTSTSGNTSNTSQTNPYRRDNNQTNGSHANQNNGSANSGGSSNQTNGNVANNGANTNQNNSATTNNSTSSGQFKAEGGKVYYIKDGKKVTGWQKIDGKTYYFETDGVMKKAY